MNAERSNGVWKVMFNADLNARCWRYMSLRYTRRDGYARIFLKVDSRPGERRFHATQLH